MALISHDHELIFLKTAKTAGTSVEMFLEAICSGSDTPVLERTHARQTERLIVGMRLVEKAERLPLDEVWYNHMPAAEIRDRLGPERWDRYRKVTTVRNPFDLAVSRFHWTAERRGDLPIPEDVDRQREAFSHFVKTAVFRSSADITHIDGVFAVDHILRFETLPADLRTLCADLGLRYDPAILPHAKATSWRRFGLATEDYYTPETEEIVLHQYAWMFDHGGYSRSVKELAGGVGV
ncbi:hypothetical protein AAD018_003910 [Aestuariibius insulae]|uniref:hypothetical protein n=1 Tax=Aestuariibius insulae TaxID=2058287 RepID=UPI00345EC186